MNDNRFPPNAHLRTPKQFSAGFAHGKRAGGRYFRCVFKVSEPSEISAGARLGMAISRKVDRRAVERNRIRRLIREWFRHERAAFVAGDFIVSGKPEARGIPADQLFADLSAVARRLGLKRVEPTGTMPSPSLPSSSDDGS